MKNYIVFFIVAIIIVTFNSCRKEKAPGTPNNMYIYLDSVNNILLHSADAYASFNYYNNDVEEFGFCWSSSPNPTLKDASAICWDTSNYYTQVQTLDTNSTYYIVAYAIYGNETVYSNEIEITTWDGKIVDVDGNYYQGVQVGNQGWMGENLKTTRYSDGTQVFVSADHANQYYWYGQGHSIMPNEEADMDFDGDIDSEDSLIYVNRYGLLYTWYSANNIYDPVTVGWEFKKVTENARDICPEGWHLPGQDEWSELRGYLNQKHGSDSVAIALKSKDYWLKNNNGADLYGFGLIPGGSWHNPESTHFITMGNKTSFWTSTEGNSVNGISQYLHYSFITIDNGFVGKSLYGFSVRCVKNK